MKSAWLIVCMEARETQLNYFSSVLVTDREVASDPNFGLKSILVLLVSPMNVVTIFGTFPCCSSCIFFAIRSPAWTSLFTHKGIGIAVVSRTTLNISQWRTFAFFDPNKKLLALLQNQTREVASGRILIALLQGSPYTDPVVHKIPMSSTMKNRFSASCPGHSCLRFVQKSTCRRTWDPSSGLFFGKRRMMPLFTRVVRAFLPA